MTNVGYATLQIIPSMSGFTPRLAEGLAPELSKAGLTAGRKMGEGISTGAKEGTKTGGLFTNVEKGAEVAGVGAGRRFGTALHETIGEYGKTIGATMVGFFAYEKVKEFLSGTVEEARKAAAEQRVTEAIIKSTGDAAHVTADHVDELSNAMSKKTGIDKTAIGSAENVLLTFKAVHNEVGKGNDIFDQASHAMLDISAVMAGSGGSDSGNSAAGAAKQLGKALSDPVKGISALTRLGIVFTEQQKKQIKAMVESGNTLEAQRTILSQVESRFGGAAAASGDAVSKMTASYHVFQEELGKKALPTIEGLAQGVTSTLIPAMSAGGDALLHLVDNVSKLPSVVKDLAGAFLLFQVASKVGVITSLTTAFGQLRAGVQLTAEAYTTARASQGVLTSGMSALAQGASLTSGAFRRSIAGVGGMAIALSGLTSSSNKTVSALSSIGSGALLGFSVGGPWGAAIGAGIAGLGQLVSAGGQVSKSEDGIRASMQSLTDTLNQQTGALTANSTAAAEKALADNGVYEAAKKIGVNLGDLTSAYLGNAAAAHRVSVETETGYYAALKKGGSAFNGVANAANIVTNAYKTSTGALADARNKILDTATANKELAQSNSDTGQTYQSYADQIDAAKSAIQKLMDAEDKRRNNLLKQREDVLGLQRQVLDTNKQAATATGAGRNAGIYQQIADVKRQGALQQERLRSSLAATKSEQRRAIIEQEIAAAQGKESERLAKLNAQLALHTKGLDGNTQAGNDNLRSLYDLINQWNSSTTAVKKTKGMYEEVRKTLIADATQMGANAKQVKDLTRLLDGVPGHVNTYVGTPGLDKALKDLEKLQRKLQQMVKDNRTLAVYVSAHQAGDRRLAGARATGGPVSKGLRYLVGENGPEEFTAPANGSITPNNRLGGRGGNTFVHNGDVRFNNEAEYLRWQQSRALRAGGGGVNWP